MFSRVARVIFRSAFLFGFVTVIFFVFQENIFGIVIAVLAVSGLLVIFFIQKSKLFLAHYNQIFGDTILGLSGIIFIIGCLGNLYLFDNWASYWFGFDTVAHFALPAIFTIVAAMLYELFWIKKKMPNAVEVLLISAFTVVIFSFLWELFEKQSDIWWGTKIFWNPARPIAVDTADDLIADFYGALVGCVLIFRNWTSWNKIWLKGDVHSL